MIYFMENVNTQADVVELSAGVVINACDRPIKNINLFLCLIPKHIYFLMNTLESMFVFNV